MCGIAGIISRRFLKHEFVSALKQMGDTLRHRGPDDEGFFLSGRKGSSFFSGADTPENVRLGSLIYTSEKNISLADDEYKIGFSHRRLSILDLSERGHQPMCDEQQKVFITYNGEMYNYRELREELMKLGFHFTSQTDTEVIVNAYKAWGKKCLSRFNGMWSFVIYDVEKKEIFAARDRFGVKPFYYYFDEAFFCFASEIKALVHLPFVKTGINQQAVCDFLLNDELEFAPQGLFQNVLELFPAHFLALNTETFALNIERYYELNKEEEKSFLNYDDQSLIDEIQSKLIQSIRLRLRADVPVGACVSGGIDSGVIAGVLLSELNTVSPDFFSAVFPGNKADESVFAKEVIQQGGTWNCVEPDAEGLWKDLEELIYSQDTPLWSSSTYAQYLVMKKSKEKNVKVLLDGQGGDELFAGYVPYFLSFWNELRRQGNTERLKNEMNLFPGAMNFRLREFIKSKTDTRALFSLKKIKNPALRILNNDFISEYHRPPTLKRQYNSLNEHLRAEFCDTRLKLYLKCEDRCSMWHSVESRTPFADDIDLISFIFKIPGNKKIKNGTSKYLLREAGKKFLPEKIYSRRDKMGYLTPHNQWLTSLYSTLREEDFSGIMPYLNPGQLNRQFQRLFSPAGENEQFLAFKILTFNKWKRLFNL